MFKKILYPTDLSDVSLKALDFLKQLRECGSEEVLVLHVIPEQTILTLRAYGEGTVNVDEFETGLMEKATKSVAEVEAELKKFGYKVKKMINTGFPLREILTTEQEEDISLIVIGSHGKSNLEEMFLGSVSEKVIRKCKSPVLVIKR
ncbi:MAG: universal stress protein [Deltaproteobacteria bacterium]|nr:universal stress protein [Deltaproteobacteria bacterium]